MCCPHTIEFFQTIEEEYYFEINYLHLYQLLLQEIFDSLVCTEDSIPESDDDNESE